MTVKEFIDKLSKFNPDDEVYIEYCRPYEVTIIYTDVNDEVVYNEEDNLKGVKIIIYDELRTSYRRIRRYALLLEAY